jgi:hypothetical protein
MSGRVTPARRSRDHSATPAASSVFSFEEEDVETPRSKRARLDAEQADANDDEVGTLERTADVNEAESVVVKSSSAS